MYSFSLNCELWSWISLEMISLLANFIVLLYFLTAWVRSLFICIGSVVQPVNISLVIKGTLYFSVLFILILFNLVADMDYVSPSCFSSHMPYG